MNMYDRHAVCTPFPAISFLDTRYLADQPNLDVPAEQISRGSERANGLAHGGTSEHQRPVIGMLLASRKIERFLNFSKF